MPVSYKITVELNGVDRKLLSMGDMKFNEPLKQSGIYMEGSIGRRFRSGGGSRPWKGLSPATIKIHPRRAGGKVLNDTGRLRKSVTSGAVKQVTGSKLRYSWGSNLVYAGIHNFGGRAGWGRVIPQREFLYFDSKDEKAITRIFEDFVKGLSK